MSFRRAGFARGICCFLEVEKKSRSLALLGMTVQMPFSHPVPRVYFEYASSTRNQTVCGKTQNSVILSEAKNLSLFLFLYLNRREILRFAQNDKTRLFSAVCKACATSILLRPAVPAPRACRAECADKHRPRLLCEREEPPDRSGPWL